MKRLEARVGDLERQGASGAAGLSFEFWVRCLCAEERGEPLPVARGDRLRGDRLSFAEWVAGLEGEGCGG